MSKKKVTYHREALKAFKERHGGKPSEEMNKVRKHNAALVKDVKKAIQEIEENATVPLVAEKVDYPTDEIWYAFMALLKWDSLIMVSKRGEYPEFKFKR